MIFRLIPIIVILAVGFWLLQKVQRLPQESRNKAYKTIGLWSLVTILVLGVLTGRMHWLGMFFAFIIGAVKVGWRFFPVIKLFASKTALSNPVFSTKTIKFTFDVNDQVLDGHVEDSDLVNDDIKNKRLSDLSLNELQTLRDSIKEIDKRGYYLLYVLLQQRGSFKSGDEFNSKSFNDVESPSINEARQILGLSDGFTKKDVVNAHRKLIQKLHPDRGGNDYLASRINLAKSILLEHIKH